MTDPAPPPLRYPPQDPAAFKFFNEIGVIAQLSANAFERVMPEGLSMAGFSVLNHLERLPGDWAPARLARAFQVTKGAMTNTLQRLEARGLVAVTADPRDGRGKLVEITPQGRAVRGAALAALAPLLAQVQAALPAAEMEAALPLLARVRAYLDAARE